MHKITFLYFVLCPHGCQCSVKTYKCCTRNRRKHYSYVCRSLYRLTQQWVTKHIVCLPQKLKRSYSNALTELVHLCPTELSQIIIEKVQFQNQQCRQHPPPLWGSLNALLLEQSISNLTWWQYHVYL